MHHYYLSFSSLARAAAAKRLRKCQRFVVTTNTTSTKSERQFVLFRSKSTLAHDPIIMDDDDDNNDELSRMNINNNMTTPIYVAATRQHVGKTSVSLALVSGLQKHFGTSLGFMKPVGQQSLTAWEEDLQQTVLIDKDVALVRQHFGLDYLLHRYMSPVLIPPGYTRDFLDGNISTKYQHELIQNAYNNIIRATAANNNQKQQREQREQTSTSSINNNNVVVLCEGTGHTGVGSIVRASNARVASWLGAHMVLVANGGIGSAFDDLELNRMQCEKYNVPIAGVIINKVLPEKYEQTRHYMERVLTNRWNVPLLGCIPDRPFLGCPTLSDLEKLLDGTLIVSSLDMKGKHYATDELNLVATSVNVFLRNLRQRQEQNNLFVCHGSQKDIVLAFMAAHSQWSQTTTATTINPKESALIICCDDKDHHLEHEILNLVRGAATTSTRKSPSILVVSHSTQYVMEQIHSFTPKLNTHDTSRVSETVHHYEPYIDFDLLLERTQNNRRHLTNNQKQQQG